MMERWTAALVATALTLTGSTPALSQTAIEGGDLVIVLVPSQLKVEQSGVHSVRQGTMLGVEKVEGDWLWVSHGKSGWIHRRNVIPRDQAVAYFSERLLRDPRDADAYRARGKALLSLGDTKRALADFNEALRRSRSPLLYSDRGLAWTMAGEYDRAIEDFGRALASQDTQPMTEYEVGGVYCMRGLAWVAKGELSPAIADLDRAVGLCPEFAFAYNQRGRTWLALGNSTMKAVSDFNQALRLNPIYDAAFNNRGLAWAKMGELEKAAADFRRAIQLNPDSVFVGNTRSKMLHDAARQSSRPLDAEATSETTALLDPTDSAYNNLALLLAAAPDAGHRNGKEALELAGRACQLDGYMYYPLLSTLAAAYAESGDFENAVRWQEKAIELAPEKSGEELQSRLALYQAGKPFRQKPETEE
jgi:tetratricopeptide (TPR) repeat protein